MKNFKNLLVVLMLISTSMLLAQTKLTGSIVDNANQPLPGATLIIKGTQVGSTSNFDGKFSLETSNSNGTILISFMGFETKTISYEASTDFGVITLDSSAESLDEVVVIGSGIIDLAKNRTTPIAVSTIKASEIQSKSGDSDLIELFKSTPSIQTVQGGGYGDGRMFLRGFDQTNTAFLLNGQPVNGMEDGKMYWSNWSGMTDVANAVQIQRGLGSSKLAISSVGGTINIVSKTIDTKEGGFYKTIVGNDDYIKNVAYYSTGLMENGLAVSAMFGHWQGSGYMDGAKGQGQTYLISFGYKPNDNHIFNFMLTGAPQWHGSAGNATLSTYLNRGRRFSNWYGFKAGELYPGGRNFYHKPVLNLSWDWTISEKSTLSTVVYASIGRGGFALPDGPTFYTFWNEGFGSLDYDAIIAANKAGTDKNIFKSFSENHNWYGMVTNYNVEINENLNLNIGADARFYNGQHFRTVVDFLGLDSYDGVSNANIGNYNITEATGYNPWVLNRSIANDQRLDYDYEENINYIGTFGQLEYKKDNISVFIQGAISNQSHVKNDFWNFSEDTKSEKINNIGYNIKSGLSYNIDQKHIFFGNVGYYSRQPFHDQLFTSIKTSNELNPFGDENQKVTGLEAGYSYRGNNVSLNLNIYNTIWDNRILSSAKDTNNDNVSDEFTQSSGVKQVHKGIELDIVVKPNEMLTLNAFASIGDWVYKGDVETKTLDLDGTILESGNIAYLDGTKVGEAAQFTAGLGFVLAPAKGLKFDANWNLNAKMYGLVDLASSEFENKNNRGSIELPSYNTVDAGLSYKLPLSDNKNLKFRLNVNNVFNEFYIQGVSTNNYAEIGDDTWKGINTSNKVDLGYGTTWNFTVQFNF